MEVNMAGRKVSSGSSKAFSTALTAKDPFKELLKMAADFVRKGDINSLYNIDVMLNDRFVEYLRNGNIDDLETFQMDVLYFTDGETGTQLKESEEGEKYFYRWHHFLDLFQLAIGNYDPALIKRFVESRKYGKEMLTLLYDRPDGIRHNELSKKLDISPQYLSKLLREFQAHDLVSRERKNKVSMITLGLIGRAYMKENQDHPAREEAEYHINTEDKTVVAERREEYTVGIDNWDMFVPRSFFHAKVG